MEKLLELLTGNIGTVILLLILWKSGLLKFLVERKNGNGEARRNEDLGAKLTLITDNHLTHLQDGMKDLSKLQAEQCDKLDRILYSLESIDKYGVKIRKR